MPALGGVPVTMDGGALSPSVLGLASLTLLLASLIGLYFLRGGSSRTIKEAAHTNGDAKHGNGHAMVADTRQGVAILFGTQTGTAEKFAKTLAEDLKRRYPDTVNAVVRDLEALNDTNTFDQLKKEKMVLVLQATYGDGEPTDTSAAFYHAITTAVETSDGTTLSGLSAAVFGLGNRQYEHFNSAGKGVHKALKELGAKMMLPVGLGDDDGTLEEDFAQWRSSLWPALEAHFPSIAGSAADDRRRQSLDDSEAAAPPSYDCVMHPPGTKPAIVSMGQPPYNAHNPYVARVTGRKELHSGGGRSCLHVEIDLSGSNITYEAGDHLAIFPENSPAVVAAAAKALRVPLDTVFTLTPVPGLPAPFPGPITLRQALAQYADLLTPPRKTALAALAAHASDAAQAARLKHLASRAGKDEYSSWIVTPYRSLLEVMEHFSSAAPPLGAFFGGVAPRLAHRYYSISSSPKAGANTVTATVAVVNGPTPTGRVHKGVCSTWLGRVDAGAAPAVPVYVRTSTFRLPKSAATPIVMVGPGTGLAPFRGFIQEREALKAGGGSLGPALLFFGCRTKANDYIYREELEGALAKGVISDLQVAFSREKGAKLYVQHQLAEQGAAVWGLLQQGAYLYVCGDAKGMARDVHRALHDLAQAQGKMSSSQAEAFVKDLQHEGRYQRDVW